MSQNSFSEETDFSADEITDPDYVPQSKKRKLATVADSQRCQKPAMNMIFKAEFFTNVERFNQNNKFVTNAKCSTCGRVIRAAGDVSSNFITHLKAKHADVYLRYKSLKEGSLYSTSQERFDYRLLKAIVDCTLPVAIVDRKSFIDLFEDTGLKVMSRQTAMKKLEVMHCNMLINIKVIISKVKYFCTTSDIWSGNHRSYLGYTCHWINDKFERKSAALACTRIRGVHSAEKIAQIIKEINDKFGLNSSNIIMSVTDNGSNFLKAFRDYGIDESFEESEDESDDELPNFQNDYFLGKHHRCSSHTLNLLATNDYTKVLKTDEALLKRHNTAFKKCKKLWKKCKWAKSSEIIVEVLGCSLTVPVVTRWNSLYDSVVKLLFHKEMLSELNDRLSLSHFSSEDIEYLESFKALMQPISEALDFLQGEHNLIFGYLLLVLMTLSTKLKKISKGTNNVLSLVAQKLEIRLRQRFEIFFTLSAEANVAITAAVLTPDVKLNWLKVLQKDNAELTEEIVLRRVVDTINVYIQKDKLFYPTALSSPEPTTSRSAYFSFDDEEEEDNSSTGLVAPNKDGMKSMIKNQLYSYLNDTSRETDIWKSRTILKEAAKLFNTPLTSSAPVERLFSFAGIINAPKRQSLTDLSFEILVLLKANTHFIN